MNRTAGALIASVALLWQSAAGMSPANAALPKSCASEIAAMDKFDADVSRLSSGYLGLDGRTVVLGDDFSSWAVLDEEDATFTHRFHSLAWLVPAWQRGVRAVDFVLQHAALLPDPGSGAAPSELLGSGWTEGAVRLRMGTVSCLYQVSGDERLVPIMTDLVAANLDPRRYRGLPLNAVHNHGALANAALIEAARVFNRPDWSAAAEVRFDADASSVFSACGMSKEQSTSYHLLNVRLWRRSLRLVSDELPFHAGMGSAVQSAELAAIRLARPDGVLEAIGDGNEQSLTPSEAGLDDSAASALDPRLFCSDFGWAANRSSWDDTAIHYTLRFGPRPRFHGHEDRGAVTWFARGIPVFSDRGLFDKAKGSRRAWARSSQAHSTFARAGFRWRGNLTADMVSRDDSVDEYVLSARTPPVSMERRLEIPLTLDDSGNAILHADDSGLTPYYEPWSQRWQLAPGWKVLPSRTAGEPLAVHVKSGLLLYGACWSGRFVAPVSSEVEHFGQWRTSSKAVAFECSTVGAKVRIDTLWVVSDIRGTLDWDRATGAVRIVPDAEPVISEGEVGGSAA